jgi:uncharacterized repeat protein (TIGR01451 family)
MYAKPPATALLAAALAVLGSPLAHSSDGSDQRQVGVPYVGAAGVHETVQQIMEREAATPPRVKPRLQPEHEVPDRRGLPQDPLARPRRAWPPPTRGEAPGQLRGVPSAPQTLGTQFTGATLADTGAFPPDTMGAVGPTQFVVFLNGRVRTFNKTTGVADGVINADADTFFASVMTPVSPPVVLNFTSDPQVRYDRLSGRWILTIIDVPSASAIADTPNRLLIAVSDAASAGVISAGTVWTFYFVQQNTVGGGNTGEFLDYPSLGVDANALYVGGNMFVAATGAFANCSAWVIRKSSILSGGPVVVTAFRNLLTSDGPLTPRGVDNYDPASNEGYIMGVSAAVFGRLVLRRVSTPGATPAISADIPITVNATSLPIPVDHLGNTGGNNGRLDALDDRLFAVHIRNHRLWTAHNIAVTSTGVASNSNVERRNGARWYELNVPVGSGTPTVVQSGTVFDTAATLAAARQFWIPSVMVSGQGHAALGFSTAGTPFRANAATVGRLVGDTLGTTQGAPVVYTASATAYNPASDPGGANGRRWGDYSFTTLDPNDDMTMWTIQQFCDAANSYGVRAVKLIAPPPATPDCSTPAQVTTSTQNVTITGTSSSGSGFFDPGAGFPNRLQASVTGGVTVNSVTFNNPTSVTLNVTATTNGLKNVTLTNPDGQSVLGTGCINVNVTASANLGITKTDGQVTEVPGTSVTYTIVASNAGPSPVTGATVTDTVAAAITGATWTCVGAGGGTCTANGAGSINDSANLPVGGTATYTLTGTISASATGTLSNTATVTAPGGVTDPTPGNNSATDTDTLTPQADLLITKTDGQTTAVAGSPITYTIVASNAGPGPATGATVGDTVPAAITGATWTCVGAGGGTCTANGAGNINDPVNLPVGGSVTYTLTGTISPGAVGTLSNTATVAAPGGVTDPALGNNSATDTDILLGLDYFTLPPCRVIDTRGGAPLGGGVMQGQETRSFAVAGLCGIPVTAKAISVNLAVTQPTVAGNVRLFPTGLALPTISSINYVAGQTRSNNAIVPLSALGELSAFVGQTSGTVHLVIDVNGYFQ